MDEEEEVDVRRAAFAVAAFGEMGGEAGGSGNSSRGEVGCGGGESRKSASVRRARKRERKDATSL